MKRTRRDVSDLEWRMDRQQAEQVACPRCEAAVGESCRNPITGDELRAPAHPSRLVAAEHRTTQGQP